MIDFKYDVPAAEQKIRPYLRETPLEYSLFLSEMANCNAYVKLENLQHTGSFKARGALHKLLSLAPEEREMGIVTASTGNHGAATAFGLHALNMKGTIFVPENASPTKVAAIKRLRADVRTHGLDGVETEIFARDYANDHKMTYISPYNDPQVVVGQGTIAAELARQLDCIDTVMVALGGGGLVSGIAGYLKTVFPKLNVIACSPQNSPVMCESLKANRIVEMESLPTLSDGTAGGVEPGAITFPLCKALIDDHVLVSEEEIKAAMLDFMDAHPLMIEGAAGVALAAFTKMKKQFKGQHVVIVICGGNISLKTLEILKNNE